MAYKQKRIYAVGEKCDVCGTPTIQGRYGAYCWTCWSKKKDEGGGGNTDSPRTHYNAPGQEFSQKMTQSTSSEHSVALKAYLAQLENRIKALEKRQDESPLWIKNKGQWEIVPLAFGE